MYRAFSQINYVKEFVSRDHEKGNGQKWWMQAKLQLFLIGKLVSIYVIPGSLTYFYTHFLQNFEVYIQ